MNTANTQTKHFLHVQGNSAAKLMERIRGGSPLNERQAIRELVESPEKMLGRIDPALYKAWRDARRHVLRDSDLRVAALDADYYQMTMIGETAAHVMWVDHHQHLHVFTEPMTQANAQLQSNVDETVVALEQAASQLGQPFYPKDVRLHDRRALAAGSAWPDWIWAHDGDGSGLFPVGLSRTQNELSQAMLEAREEMATYRLSATGAEAQGRFSVERVDMMTAKKLVALEPAYTYTELAENAESGVRHLMIHRPGDSQSRGKPVGVMAIEDGGRRGSDVTIDMLNTLNPTDKYAVHKVAQDAVSETVGLMAPIRDITIRPATNQSLVKRISAEDPNFLEEPDDTMLL